MAGVIIFMTFTGQVITAKSIYRVTDAATDAAVSKVISCKVVLSSQQPFLAIFDESRARCLYSVP